MLYGEMVLKPQTTLVFDVTISQCTYDMHHTIKHPSVKDSITIPNFIV